MLGFVVRAIVGRRLGAREGLMVGAGDEVDGANVGLLVCGVRVGLRDGTGIGAFEGMRVGDEGAMVGVTVGPEGANEGKTVGEVGT